MQGACGMRQQQQQGGGGCCCSHANRLFQVALVVEAIMAFLTSVPLWHHCPFPLHQKFLPQKKQVCSNQKPAEYLSSSSAEVQCKRGHLTRSLSGCSALSTVQNAICQLCNRLFVVITALEIHHTLGTLLGPLVFCCFGICSLLSTLRLVTTFLPAVDGDRDISLLCTCSSCSISVSVLLLLLLLHLVRHIRLHNKGGAAALAPLCSRGIRALEESGCGEQIFRVSALLGSLQMCSYLVM